MTPNLKNFDITLFSDRGREKRLVSEMIVRGNCIYNCATVLSYTSVNPLMFCGGYDFIVCAHFAFVHAIHTSPNTSR